MLCKHALSLLALMVSSSAVSLEHENVKTFDMFPDHYEHGAHHAEFDHTAFLGGIKAAEEFENLHEPQAKEKLAIIIKGIDYNNNAVIEKEELIAHLRESLRKIDVEAAEWQFGEADSDSSGLVSLAEYMEHTFGYMKQQEKEKENTKTYMDHVTRVFGAADRDNDNELSKHEYLAVHNPSNSQETEKLELEYLMNIMDVDKDGALSFEEWLKEGEDETDIDMDDPGEQDYLDEERIIFEEEVDHNRDGYARGFQELVNIVRPQYHFEAQDEAEHLIEMADMDTDDHLSYQEILDRYELFSGSMETHKGVYHHDDEL